MGSPLGWLQVLVLYSLHTEGVGVTTWLLASRVRQCATAVSPYWSPCDEDVAASARRLVRRGLVTTDRSMGRRWWAIAPDGLTALAAEADRLVNAGIISSSGRVGLTEAVDR